MTTATVKIWGKDVGAVTWVKEQRCGVFEYDPSFISTGLELSPMHMSLDDARAGTIFSFPNLDNWTFNGLPGLLANSLPDSFGNSVIDAWLTRQGRSPQSFNPVERLCYIGRKGMGALEYVPSLGPKSLDKTAEVEVESLMELAQDVLSFRTDLGTHIAGSDHQKAEAMLDILRVGVSAGGMVPKAVIAINDEGHVLSGQTDVPEGYEHWMLKFDGIDADKHGRFGKSKDDCRVEYAYHLMAEDAGINMSECKLLEENGRAHFMTKRFDRIHNEKVHVLNLASIGHLGWNSPGAIGYESAFQIMRALRLPYPEQEQQFKRMVFNAVARNVDDHVKNHAYIMDKDGTWQLSPAFDLTFSVNTLDPLGEMHKMTINGRQDDFRLDDFVDVAGNMGINKPKKLICEILDVVEKWPEYAKEAGVSSDAIRYIGDHLLDQQSLDEGLS